MIHNVLAVDNLAPQAPRLEDVLDLVWSVRPQSVVVVDLKAAPWNADQQDKAADWWRPWRPWSKPIRART
jgi:hypothetical protein